MMKWTVSPRKSTETQGTPLPTGAHRKPRPDLYTALLVLALIAVLIGILFLYLEMDYYEFKIQAVRRWEWSAVSDQL